LNFDLYQEIKRMSRYLAPTKWLGGVALGLFIFAILFSNIAPGIVSESTRNSVLFHAIPFFAVFIGILLLFILLIVYAALRFSGKVPGRTYRGIENIIIVGILFGVVCLFNPWSFVPYRYGFLLLLISTLGFILWSHVLPARTDFESQFPPLTRSQHIAGAAAGLVVLVLLSGLIIAAASPKPPYGLRERVWNSYTDERKAEVASEATREFNTVEIPFLIVFNLFPAAIAYMVVREIAPGGRQRSRISGGTVAAPESAKAIS
jgi:hypothetical protein